MKNEHFTVSRLIIGAGVAGLRCAITLKQQGVDDFLLIGNNTLGDSHATLATGGINVVQDNQEDSYAMHMADTRRYGAGLCDPHMVEQLVTHAPQELEALLGWGARFQRSDHGGLATRRYGPQSQARSVFSDTAVGAEIMITLARQAKKLGIRFLENTTVVDILADQGTVQGVVCSSKDTDTIFTISSSCIVLATGGYTNIYQRSSSRHHESYGDGISMAYLAGASLQDLEFTQFHPTGLVTPIEYEGMIIKEIERYQGAILVNNHGERFMKQYDKDRLELAPGPIVCKAIMAQIRLGNSVFMDLSTSHEHTFFRSENNVIQSLIDDQGRVQVAPTAHFSMGGLAIDPYTYETTLSGLYAIGECTAGMHGANRLPGNSLMESLVFATALADHLAQTDLPDITESASLPSIELPHNGKLSSVHVIDEIRKLMRTNSSISTSAGHLTYAMNAFEELQEQIDTQGIKNGMTLYQSLINHRRCSHLITLAYATTKAMYYRQESRGSFTRTDYPETSDLYDKHSLLTYDGEDHHLTWQEASLPSITILRALADHPPTTQYGLVE